MYLYNAPCYLVASRLKRSRSPLTHLRSLRDLYESYVLASFLYYIIAILGDEDIITDGLLKQPDQTYGSHGRFMSLFLSDWHGREFLPSCKYGVLQYVVVKIFCTLLTIILESADEYGSGDFSLARGYFYVTFFTNLSQCLALYALIKLFYAVKPFIDPIGKRAGTQLNSSL